MGKKDRKGDVTIKKVKAKQFSDMARKEIQLLIELQKVDLKSGTRNERRQNRSVQSMRRQTRKLVNKSHALKLNDFNLNARVKHRLFKIGSNKLAHNTTVRAKLNNWSRARDMADSERKEIEKRLDLLESVRDQLPRRL